MNIWLAFIDIFEPYYNNSKKDYLVFEIVLFLLYGLVGLPKTVFIP